jgi:hypothetical protein
VTERLASKSELGLVGAVDGKQIRRIMNVNDLHSGEQFGWSPVDCILIHWMPSSNHEMGFRLNRRKCTPSG